MKKYSLILIAALLLMTQSCAQYNVTSNKGASTEKSEGSSASSSSSTSALGSFLGNIFASDKVELSQLVGTWNYSSPAVGFQSENVLKSIGGSAASAAIEKELGTYYDKLGLDNVVLTIDQNANFTKKTKFATLKGVVEKGNDGIFVFNFKAFGGINIGKLDVYTTLSGKTLSLTCDVKKIVELSKKIISITNNTTLKSIVKLLDSYDGVTAGFKLKKQ